MNTQFEIIDTSPGLEDCEFEGYEYVACERCLKIFIRAWNAKLLVIRFYEVLHFFEKISDLVADFYKAIRETPLLTKVLKLHYADGKVPENHPYQHFRFYDIDDKSFLEIICKEMSLECHGEECQREWFLYKELKETDEQSI